MASQAHRRVNERLEEYWLSLCAGRPFPRESDINPDAIAEIWDSCFMVQLSGTPAAPQFHHAYLGTDLIAAYGDDRDAKEICETLAFPNNHELTEQFAKVVRQRTPLQIDSEFTNSKGMLIKYRSCLLPLSKDDSSDVAYVLGGMRWKAF